MLLSDPASRATATIDMSISGLVAVFKYMTRSLGTSVYNFACMHCVHKSANSHTMSVFACRHLCQTCLHASDISSMHCLVSAYLSVCIFTEALLAHMGSSGGHIESELPATGSARSSDPTFL